MTKKDIIVFDVDGTLAESSLEIQDENAIILNQLKERYEIAVCGGGKLDKILKQMKKALFRRSVWMIRVAMAAMLNPTSPVT